jgi:hypothetical protein
MQPLGKQLFFNVSVNGPDNRKFDLPPEYLGSLWIIEDVSQLVPVCSFVYSETYSEFSELFPLLGNETLTVDLGMSKDKYRVFNFRYASYESRSLGAITSRNKEILTNWIDSDFIKLRKYPQVLYYPQTTASEAAKAISSGLPVEVENCRGTCDYVLNNMVVGEALKSLSNEAYSADGSTFMFFKNGNKYKFVSRNSLMRQSTKATFVHGYDLTQFSVFGNDRSLFTNPESNVIGYSYEQGQNFEYTKTPDNVKPIKASFGKSMPFGTGTDITPRFVYDGTRHTHEAEAKATSATESYMDSAMRVSFTALGQPFVSCGDVVEINIAPSFKSLGKYNMLLSGKWLVEKVVHYIAKYNYSMKIFAAKANTDFTRRKAVI